MIVLKTEGGGKGVESGWLGDDNDKEGYYLEPCRVSAVCVWHSSSISLAPVALPAYWLFFTSHFSPQYAPLSWHYSPLLAYIQYIPLSHLLVFICRRWPCVLVKCTVWVSFVMVNTHTQRTNAAKQAKKVFQHNDFRIASALEILIYSPVDFFFPAVCQL